MDFMFIIIICTPVLRIPKVPNQSKYFRIKIKFLKFLWRQPPIINIIKANFNGWSLNKIYLFIYCFVIIYDTSYIFLYVSINYVKCLEKYFYGQQRRILFQNN